jgi:DNA-binding NarL/FixJ family response regulator
MTIGGPGAVFRAAPPSRAAQEDDGDASRHAPTGVLLAATEAITARGLEAILSEWPPEERVAPAAVRTTMVTGAEGFAVLGTASTVADTEQALVALKPRLAVLVLDPPLLGAGLDDACTRLVDSHPDTAALVLLAAPTPEVVRRVCRGGARGVFRTDIEPDQLRTVLQQIASGEVVVHQSLVRHLVDGDNNGARTLLNNRELTVLQLLARGYVSKQIAPLINATPKAVDMMIERACRRLGASTRAQAVAYAIKRGLVT